MRNRLTNLLFPKTPRHPAAWRRAHNPLSLNTPGPSDPDPAGAEAIRARRARRESDADTSATHPRPLTEPLESRTLFATTIFQIDPAQSQLRLSGDAFSIDLEEQGDGSLSARYQGTIIADVDGDSIRFLGNSNIEAQTRGNFDPGNAAANYAGEAEGPFGINLGEVAVRNLVLDVTSSELPLTDGTSFTSAGAKFTVTSGVVAYDTKVGDGDEDIDGNSANNTTAAASTVTKSGDVTTLTIPIDVEVEESGVELRFRGKIVAVSTGEHPFVDANGPSETGSDYAARFIVGQGSAVDATGDALTISDPNDANLASGRVTLTGNVDGDDERLGITGNVAGITTSYNADTGVLTLTGNRPLADYQAALRNLTYFNEADNPTPGDRTLTITLNDGDASGPASVSTVRVLNPNTAILGTGGSKTVVYREADGSIATLTLKGGGTATLRFTGASEQIIGTKGNARIEGTNVALAAIEVTDSTDKSKLAIKAVAAGGGDAAVSIGSISAAGDIASIGGKGVDLTGGLTVTGTVAAATFRDITGATLAAGRIGKLTLIGSMTGATLNLTAPFAAGVPSLGALAVTGAITDSRITSAGSIGSIKAAAMTRSQAYAGRSGTAAFPATAADFSADATTIDKLTLGSKKSTAATFDNAVIAARVLGAINLGLVDTDNAGEPFGLSADRIAGLSATNGAGGVLKAKKLDDPATAQATLAATGFAFGDLTIRAI